MSVTFAVRVTGARPALVSVTRTVSTTDPRARNCAAAVRESLSMIVRRPAGLSDGQASRVAAKFADFVGLGFQQDVEIWLHKTRIDNPLLCAEDGPVYQVRRWYEQFYRDVADVEPDMVARFEFEIDTTRAVAGWEAEVAANLAQRGHAS